MATRKKPAKKPKAPDVPPSGRRKGKKPVPRADRGAEHTPPAADGEGLSVLRVGRHTLTLQDLRDHYNLVRLEVDMSDLTDEQFQDLIDKLSALQEAFEAAQITVMLIGDGP